MEMIIEEDDMFEHTELSKLGWHDHFAGANWRPGLPIDYNMGRTWAEAYDREQQIKPARPILERMRKAFENGTGVEISAEELQILAITDIVGVWEEPDPRLETIVPDGEIAN
jgi:hypothetical protein